MISSSTAADVARGVSRLLLDEGYSPILEFTLPNGRRLDVAAIGPGGEMLGVEIKVALADLKGDSKWPEYLDYCDLFYFAIPPDFPDSGLQLRLALGAEIADDVPLHEFPAILLERVPQLQQYRFLISADQIVIVQPNNRSIALVIDKR